MMTVGCGDCRACCRVLGVQELSKPKDTACSHSHAGIGCGVYATRPASCRAYVCIWLQSQSGPTPLPGKLRPDRSGVVFDANSRDDDVIVGRVLPHNRHRIEDPLVRSFVGAAVEKGLTVYIMCGSERIVATNNPVRTKFIEEDVS